MTDWVSIKSSLPALAKPVLVTDGRKVLVGHREATPWDPSRWYWAADGVRGYDWVWEFDFFPMASPITHWMPLPELPGEAIKAASPFLPAAP